MFIFFLHTHPKTFSKLVPELNDLLQTPPSHPPCTVSFTERIHKGAGKTSKTEYTHHPYHNSTSLRHAVLTAMGWEAAWLPLRPILRT